MIAAYERSTEGDKCEKQRQVRRRIALAMFINRDIPRWVPDLVVAGIERDMAAITRLWREHIHSPSDLDPVCHLLCEVFGEAAVDRALDHINKEPLQ